MLVYGLWQCWTPAANWYNGFACRCYAECEMLEAVLTCLSKWCSHLCFRTFRAFAGVSGLSMPCNKKAEMSEPQSLLLRCRLCHRLQPLGTSWLCPAMCCRLEDSCLQLCLAACSVTVQYSTCTTALAVKFLVPPDLLIKCCDMQ